MGQCLLGYIGEFMFGSEWTCLLVRHKIMHAVRYGVSGASTGSFLDPFFFFLFSLFFLGWGGGGREREREVTGISGQYYYAVRYCTALYIIFNGYGYSNK